MAVAVLLLPHLQAAGAAAQAAPVAPQAVPIIGEIQLLTLNNSADVWSGGTMVVGGQNVILPRNLLMDYPANRLTLQQTFAQAPAACVANGESGLAKFDKCNLSGHGTFAMIQANRISAGVIAGDVFLQKGLDIIQGNVTYINYAEGYFRLDGNPNDATTGVMVRMNDPTSRHTVQRGAGCAGTANNCSPDPRFTEDPDNYTQASITGYPMCLPSTVARTFADTLNLSGTGNPATQLTAQANPDGSGDILCPTTNRPAPTTDPLLAHSLVVTAGDSRRLAPIMLGDSVLASGSFETVNSVQFLSTWATSVGVKMETKNVAGQPDYVILNKMFIDAPDFQPQRVKSLFEGNTTHDVSDVMIWSVHRDPAKNAAHEFPLATSTGCDTAVGKGLCTQVDGIPTAWRIKYDVDFRPTVPVNPSLFPCPQLQADARFGTGLCPVGGLEDNFSVLSPEPHEVQVRTGTKIANPNLQTIDLLGNPATNGQYLFPMGMGLGGAIDVPALGEINASLLGNPTGFSGITWNLDRRLSPNGCLPSGCEATPQPLDPFPFEGVDPRTQAANVLFAGAGVPSGNYNDPHFTASPLTNAQNRILSFVDPAVNNFNGDKSILAWPPATPAAKPISSTPSSPSAPLITAPGTPTITGVTAGNSQATVTFTPPASNGGSAITSFTVSALVNGAPPNPPITTTVPGTATSATVTGLTNGTGYAFIVSAANAAGSGGNSAPSSTVTPGAPGATAPGAPTAVTATGGNAQATVSWTAPASNGGSAITSYTVTSSPAGGTATVRAPAGGTAPTTATVTGLTNGTTYTFTVTATNAAGTSPASAPSNGVTPAAPAATAPGAPTGATATAGNAQATVSWTAPASNGGSAITSYTVTSSPAGGSATVSAPVGGTAPTTATVTGLTNGTTYTFAVTATNAVGTGAASAPSNSVTPTAPPPAGLAAPGAPVQSVATPSKLTVASPIQNSTIPITLKWSASSSGGITSYQLQQSTNGGAFVDASVQPTGTATSATVALPMGDLLTAPAYQFQVRACSNATTCSSFAVGPSFRLVPVDDNVVGNIAYRGGWTVAPVPGAYGGFVHFSTNPGANATLDSLTWTVTGNGAWVSTLGPDRGIATVSVDGGPATVIDLFAPTQQPAQVVWTMGNLAPGTHTVTVTVKGTANPASTGIRVDVDAFAVII